MWTNIQKSCHNLWQHLLLYGITSCLCIEGIINFMAKIHPAHTCKNTLRNWLNITNIGIEWVHNNCRNCVKGWMQPIKCSLRKLDEEDPISIIHTNQAHLCLKVTWGIQSMVMKLPLINWNAHTVSKWQDSTEQLRIYILKEITLGIYGS